MTAFQTINLKPRTQPPSFPSNQLQPIQNQPALKEPHSAQASQNANISYKNPKTLIGPNTKNWVTTSKKTIRGQKGGAFPAKQGVDERYITSEDGDGAVSKGGLAEQVPRFLRRSEIGDIGLVTIYTR